MHHHGHGQCEGKGRAGDLEKLETLADYVSRGSLCGLGQTAASAIQSAVIQLGVGR